MSEASNPLPVAVPDTRPVPSRFWWLKRLAITAGVLTVALLAARGWLGWMTERKLHALLDSYRAAGQPLYGPEFDPPSVADGDNAVKCYEAAWTGIRTQISGTTVEFDAVLGDAAAPAAQPGEFQKLVEANHQPLALLRAARAKPQADWGVRLRSPMVTMLFPALNPHRRLAKLACTAAVTYQQNGDHAEAVETLRDALDAGQKMETLRGFLIGHLVALGIQAQTCYAIEQIAPALTTDDARHAAARPAKPATRAQVKALIADLLDEKSLQEGWRLAICAERASMWDTTEQILQGRLTGIAFGGGASPMPNGGMAFLLKPVFWLDAARMLEYTTRVLEAGQARDWPAAQKMLPEFVDRPRDPLKQFSRLLSSILLSAHGYNVEQNFRGIALRRLAAAALAIRLYELDHGRRPDALAQLVPDYLPAVPVDPFAADGRPLGYRLDASLPRLYSVNRDGVDENGKLYVRDFSEVAVASSEGDIPFFLNGGHPRRLFGPLMPPAGPDPSTNESVEQDQPVQDDGGDGKQQQDAQRQP